MRSKTLLWFQNLPYEESYFDLDNGFVMIEKEMLVIMRSSPYAFMHTMAFFPNGIDLRASDKIEHRIFIRYEE